MTYVNPSDFRHTDRGTWSADASDLALAPGQWPSTLEAVVDGQRVTLTRERLVCDGDRDVQYGLYVTTHSDYRRTQFRVYND